MASLGEFNAQGQMRLDAPYLRMVESGVRGDLDALAYMLIGEQPMVVKGFELLSNPVGLEASLIAFKVASSRILHPLASESGSIFAVPSNRPNEAIDPNSNPRVQGSVQPGTTTYISIDLKRSADASTSDVVAFLDPSQNQEYSQKIPLRRTLDYVWIVSQSDFTFNRSVCPVAIVTTNSLNVITSFQDARPLLGRLTPGGSVPSAVSMYGWPGGRSESVTNPIAGDKALRSFKDVINAVETRLWELGGGDFWYSPTADRNVHLHTGASTFSSSGESFEVVGTTPNFDLHWKGLSFSYDNSPQFTTAIEDQTFSFATLTDLASGDCIYIDLDRTTGTPAAVQKGQLTSLGIGSKPGSRWVIASRIGDDFYVSGQPWPIGSSSALATTSHAGTMKTNLDMASANPIAATLVPTGPAGGFVTALGISHNLDIGTAHTVATGASDITIGRLSGAGDNNIILQTDTNHGVFVHAFGSNSQPFFSVANVGGGSSSTERTDVVLDLGNSKFSGDNSWSLNSTANKEIPVPPNNGQIKKFCRPNKVWLPEVVAVLTTTTPTWTIDGTNKILTCGTTGSITIDGYPIITTDRILVNIPEFGYNGIYTVHYPGATGVSAILYRDVVFSAKYNMFNGVTVPVANGSTYAHKNLTLSCPSNYNATNIDGSTILNWVQTNSDTLDQYCIMFGDGTYTALATSSIPYAGAGAY